MDILAALTCASRPMQRRFCDSTRKNIYIYKYNTTFGLVCQYVSALFSKINSHFRLNFHPFFTPFPFFVYFSKISLILILKIKAKNNKKRMKSDRDRVIFFKNIIIVKFFSKNYCKVEKNVI